MDSILDTIKKMIGIDTADTAFDTDIIVNINSVLSTLDQLGIGPDECLVITNNTETWSQLLGTKTNIEMVKSYIYLKVKLLFDPPASSTILEAYQRQITELEWRMNAQIEEGLYLPSPPVDEGDIL